MCTCAASVILTILFWILTDNWIGHALAYMSSINRSYARVSQKTEIKSLFHSKSYIEVNEFPRIPGE